MGQANNVKTLAQLLREVLPSIVFTYSGFPSLTPPAYRQLARQQRSRYSNELPAWIYQLDVVGGADIESLLALLRSELHGFLVDDKLYPASFQTSGGPMSGQPLHWLLHRLLRVATITGPEHAAQAFYDCLRRGYMEFTNYSILSGIRLEEEISICDGISLTPLPRSTAGLPAFLPPHLPVASTDLLQRPLLTVRMAVSPLLYVPNEHFGKEMDTAFQITVDSTEAADFSVEVFCQALSLASGAAVEEMLGWTRELDDEVFADGRNGGSQYSRFTTASTVLISHSQLQESMDLYRSLADLPSSVRAYLTIPITRWINSLSYGTYVDRMLDLGVAFEALILRNIREELTFRFSLRGARYLASDRSERKQLFNQLRQFYRYRSRAVHEGTMPNQITVDGQQIETGQMLATWQGLLKDCMLKVIAGRRVPDWDAIELGS